MKDKQIATKICKLKQDFSWNFIFLALDDLWEKWCINDEKYNDLLDNLLRYVETKIAPPDDSGDVIERYVVIEYEEIQKN